MSANKANAVTNLAKKIIREVENNKRDVMAPGNLQWVILTAEEAEVLGVENDGMSQPFIPLSRLKEITLETA